MPPCSNVLIRRRIESPRRALLPLIGWASCFKSMSPPPACTAPRRTRCRRLRFLSPLRSAAHNPLNPLPPPAALPFACRRANLRGLCLSCFAAIPSCAPSSSKAAAAAAASLLNGVLSQSIGAAANQCFKLPPRQPALPCPALAALPTSSATLTPWPPSPSSPSWQCS